VKFGTEQHESKKARRRRAIRGMTIYVRQMLFTIPASAIRGPGFAQLAAGRPTPHSSRLLSPSPGVHSGRGLASRWFELPNQFLQLTGAPGNDTWLNQLRDPSLISIFHLRRSSRWRRATLLGDDRRRAAGLLSPCPNESPTTCGTRQSDYVPRPKASADCCGQPALGETRAGQQCGPIVRSGSDAIGDP